MTSRGDIVIGMDGRAVDKAVRDIVRPLLRSVGFSRFTGRTAWRYHEQTIDMVAVRSFSSYLAGAAPELGYQALLTERSRNPDFGLPGIEMPGAPDSTTMARYRDRDRPRHRHLGPTSRHEGAWPTWAAFIKFS